MDKLISLIPLMEEKKNVIPETNGIRLSTRNLHPHLFVRFLNVKDASIFDSIKGSKAIRIDYIIFS